MTAPIGSEILEDLEQFRSDVREWLEANCPASQRQPVVPEEQYWGGRRGSFASDDAKTWFERMRDKGWLVPEWPVEYGGGGLSGLQAKIIKDEMKRIQARTPLYGLGIWMLGPALLEFGNEQQKAQWLTPLLNGEIRSVFGMTEPDVASSDATNMAATIEQDGDELVINGKKWWSTGLGHPNAKITVFMGLSNPENDRHSQHSMVLVPLDTPGIEIKRMLSAYGDYDALIIEATKELNKRIKELEQENKARVKSAVRYPVIVVCLIIAAFSFIVY